MISRSMPQGSYKFLARHAVLHDCAARRRRLDYGRNLAQPLYMLMPPPASIAFDTPPPPDYQDFA